MQAENVTTAKLSWADPKNIDWEAVARRQFGKAGPANNGREEVLIVPGANGNARNGKRVAANALYGHTPEGVRFTSDVKSMLMDLNVPPEFMGTGDFSTYDTVPGYRGKHVIAVSAKDGTVAGREIISAKPELKEKFLNNLEEIIRLLYSEAVPKATKIKADSFKGLVANAEDVVQFIARMTEYLESGSTLIAAVVAPGKRGQPEKASKASGSRPAFDEDYNEVKTDSTMRTFADANPQYQWDKTGWTDDVLDSHHGIRHRVIYIACGLLNMEGNALMYPRRAKAYELAGPTLKHRDHNSVALKIRKAVIGMDMSNWDMSIDHETILKVLDTFKSIFPESTGWLWDAMKNVVYYGVDYDGKPVIVQLSELFNLSGWFLVSDIARMVMLALLKTAHDENGDVFDMLRWLQHEYDIAALCEGDDVGSTCDDPKRLDQYVDVVEEVATALGFRLEREPMFVFRGGTFIKYEGSDKREGINKLNSFFERRVIRERSLSYSIKFAPIAWVASEADYANNPYFPKARKLFEEIVGDYCGATMTDIMSVHAKFVPQEVFAYNAASLAYMTDPTSIYKGKVDEDDLDPSVVERLFVTLDAENCMQFSATGDRKYLLEALRKSASSNTTIQQKLEFKELSAYR